MTQSSPSKAFALTTDTTPSAVKSEGRTLLKRLDQNLDDVHAAEDLYSLCLFANNRAALHDTGILAALCLAMKTKSDRVKEVVARILQLFAQDGGETCLALKRLNMCNTSLEMLGKTDDVNLQIPIAGFIYWLAQNPKCKKEFVDLGASAYLKDLNIKAKDAILCKYLSYAINSMSTDVKSREEMMEDATVSHHVPAMPTQLSVSAQEALEGFNPLSSPSPRHFLNIFKTPSSKSMNNNPKTSSPSHGMIAQAFATPASITSTPAEKKLTF